MPKYEPKKIEKKWQKFWDEKGLNKTKEDKKRPKFYVLDMFPYPSGAGLHVGHPKGYIATDVIARKKMMQGYNVLHPMGWDAFGLPAENYAIANKVHPSDATDKNIKTFKKQLEKIGFTYDWEREVNTTDPEYYRWTQWIFLQMFKQGLAYESFEPINWCPKCQTGLANEDLENGKCERCGSVVERKPMRQWVLKITKYADRMLNDLEKLTEWPTPIREMQRHWIGKSEGATIKFALEGSSDNIEVFTTRPDTVFGITYLVLAPEHKLVNELRPRIQNFDEVEKYLQQAKTKSDLERTELQKEKTGVELKGVYVLHPITGDKVPVWVADYVLASYGSGAVMAVPAHDERDHEFAKRYGLKIKEVVSGGNINVAPFVEDGVNINSDFLNDLSTKEAKEKIINWLEEKGVGERKVNYKLRDWVFSRQRYWGEPIPLVHCEACKKKKQKVLLIHGFEASPETNWFKWMKRQLDPHGFEVLIPKLPDSKNPEMDEWLEALQPYVDQMGEDDIVVAHSLGTKAVLHAIEKTKVKKIGHLFLIASAIGEIELRDWGKLFAQMPEKDITALKFFWTAPLNWKKISEKVGSGQVVVSDNDKFIQFGTRGQIPSGWGFHKWHGFGHFNEAEQPKLFELIMTAKNSGWVSVPEKDLPVELPKVKQYEPTGTGESPLAAIEKWVNTQCPKCGSPAKRETNTMPQWAGSSWYYLRYIDPKNDKSLVDKEKEKYWSPVDFYVGGAEHATRHLIYARFWHKFLYDIGVVNYEEPFTRLQNVGLILAEDGRKMSKRWGNVINPDDVIEQHGADSLRVYEMFMGPFAQATAWSTNGLVGARRFLDKVWVLQEKVAKKNEDEKTLVTILHQTIKKVGEDIEAMRFNTAIAKMMELSNEFSKAEKISAKSYSLFVQILAPFAPHLAEELWNILGNKKSVFADGWPEFSPELAKEEKLTLAIQINGKVRDTVEISADAAEEAVKELALKSEKVQKWLDGKEPKKIIYVKGKLVSIVV